MDNTLYCQTGSGSRNPMTSLIDILELVRLPSRSKQPSSNESFGWGFLGMLLVGFGSVLIRGCPLRQLVAAGQGDSDAGATVMGMLIGAAMVQNWNLRGTSAGTPPSAQVAVLVGICLLFAIGLLNRRRGYGIAPEYQAGLD